MTPCKIKRASRAWRTVLPGVCFTLAAAAALDSSATFAADSRHIGRPARHSPQPNARVPARAPSLPTGPHPGELQNKQKIAPQKL
ncbi:conserved exported protein of unknown function [Burkholderia multivorans]